MGSASSKRLLGVKDIQSSDREAEIADLWVTVKAKTTDKVTRRSTKQQWVFRASKNGVQIGGGLTTGSGPRPGCDVNDPAMLQSHARIALVIPPASENSAPYVELRVDGRAYFLIGRKGGVSTSHPLARGNVLKMGACSLMVADTVFSRKQAAGGDTGVDPSEGGRSPRAHSSSCGAQDIAKVGPHGLRQEADDVCYICFEGNTCGTLDDDSDGDGAVGTVTVRPALSSGMLIPSPCPCGKLVHRLCLIRWVSAKGARVCSICKGMLPIEATVEAPYLVLQVVRHMRHLRWEGEREYILSFASPHREASAPGAGPSPSTIMVNVGTASSCDLVLPDPSLSRMHARVTFSHGGGQGQGRTEEGAFLVEDLGSQAGTYLRVQAGQPFRLPMEGESATVEGAVAKGGSPSTGRSQAQSVNGAGDGASSASSATAAGFGPSAPAASVGVARFKMGRTVLTIRVKRRKPLGAVREMAEQLLPGFLRRSSPLPSRAHSGTTAVFEAGVAGLGVSASPSPFPFPGPGPARTPVTDPASGDLGPGPVTLRPTVSLSVAPMPASAPRVRGAELGAPAPTGLTLVPALPLISFCPTLGDGSPRNSCNGQGQESGQGSGRRTLSSAGAGKDLEECRLEAAFSAAWAAAEAEGRALDPDAPLSVAPDGLGRGSRGGADSRDDGDGEGEGDTSGFTVDTTGGFLDSAEPEVDEEPHS